MISSIPSTTCSSPTNDSVRQVVKNDAVRYRRKGYGLITAIIITFSFFYFMPLLLKALWPKFETKHQADMFYLIGTLCIHTGIYTFANIIMYGIYMARLPFFERYRILNKPWPWEEDPQKWREMFKRTLKNIVLIHFVIIPTTICMDIILGYKFRLDVESFPSYSEILTTIFFLMLTEDFLFYWMHRFLHWKKIYPYIHKIHHEYSVAVSICAEYAHPIEFIFGNLFPSNIGFKILGHHTHYATYIIWMTLRLMETVDGHCGYEFSWSPYRLLPLSGSSTYHNYHHSHNIGNYSSFFTYWDTFCGTNKSYYRYLARREKENLLTEIRNEFDKMKIKNKLINSNALNSENMNAETTKETLLKNKTE